MHYLLCDVCGLMYKRKCKFICHKNTHISPEQKRYACKQCNKTFCTLGYLKIHIPIHLERQYQCDICGKILKTRVGLKFHKLSHSIENQVLCSICNKQFPYQAVMKDHIRRIHTIKSYQCELCNKLFKTKVQLRRHMITHKSLIKQ